MSIARWAIAPFVFASTTAAASPLDLSIGAGMLESAAHQSSTHGASGLGGAVELQLGYQATEQLSIGAYTSVETAQPTIESSHRDLFGATAGLRAEWHFDRTLSIDSWASLGAGARWTSLEDDRMATATSLVGIELAKFQFGGDFRVSRSLSIGPAVGVSASMFVADMTDATSEYRELDRKTVDVTITGGIRVRFNP